MIRRIAVAALFALAGCAFSDAHQRIGGPGAPYRFHFEGAREDERALIESAAWRVNDITNEAHQITFADDGERTVFVVNSSGDIPCSTPPPGQIVGCAVDGDDDGDTDVFVARDLSAYAFEVVAAHEFLHVLGLKHVPQGEGVMAPSAGPFPFSSADLAECRRVKACD